MDFPASESFVFLTHNYFDCSNNCDGCNKSIICESFKCALWFISHTRSLIEFQCEIIEFSGSSLSCIDPFFHQMSISHTKNAVPHTLGQSKKESRIMCRYQWQWTNRKKCVLKSDKPTSWPNFDSHCWNERSIKKPISRPFFEKIWLWPQHNDRWFPHVSETHFGLEREKTETQALSPVLTTFLCIRNRKSHNCKVSTISDHKFIVI